MGEEGKEENALDDLPFARNRDYGERTDYGRGNGDLWAIDGCVVQ